MNLAIIPARGGSKRIPGKNIKPFLGKPIIAYSIELALSSQLFQEVMVSTDSQEIAGISVQYGAKVPFMRSSESANDFATIADVLLEVLDKYSQASKSFDNICCIFPTAPLIQLQKLVDSYHLIQAGECTSVCPVVQYSYPIWRSLKIDEENCLKMNWAEHLNSRSQDLPAAYHDSGAFYWITSQALEQEKTLFTEKCASLVLSEPEVQDIDTEDDWKMAELKYQLLNT